MVTSLHSKSVLQLSYGKSSVRGTSRNIVYFSYKKRWHSTFPGWVVLGLPSPSPRVCTDGWTDVRWRQNQKFSDQPVTKFAYPWCSASSAIIINGYSDLFIFSWPYSCMSIINNKHMQQETYWKLSFSSTCKSIGYNWVLLFFSDTGVYFTCLNHTFHQSQSVELPWLLNALFVIVRSKRELSAAFLVANFTSAYREAWRGNVNFQQISKHAVADNPICRQTTVRNTQPKSTNVQLYKSRRESMMVHEGGGWVLPVVGYTGRLRPKGVPFLSSQYIKG